ncbi:MAG: lysoplasmalogenase family protein [Defluviitaleaceae bacterium]|nr:lysoplasmalogenase family protein [Defluviitaleaceae bacterium]
MERDIIKLTVVVICFIIAFMGKKSAINRKDHFLLVLALLATVAADYFLLIPRNYVIGVAVFCFAHIFYVLRFGGAKSWRLLPLALPLPVILLFLNHDILIVVASAYLSLFMLSYSTMIHAVRHKKYPPINNILIFAGMTLFVLCDISVVIFNAGMHGFYNNLAIETFAEHIIWLFYAPAQICLAISAREFTNKKVVI